MLVNGYLPDLEAGELLDLRDALAPALESLRERFPRAAFELTGIALHSANAATDMISVLNKSLLLAIAIIIVLIGVSLRSFLYGALTILPNLFPISVAGAYLYLTGQELQFTSIIIFTISFGIAVDSTIHVLNHHRSHHRTPSRTPSRTHARDDARAAVSATVTTMGPALILATLALMGGGVTILSPLPMAQLYGELIMLVLAAALAGDLIFLPALLVLVDRFTRS